MKKITSILMTAALLLTASCSLFLEKPDTTGTVDQEAVFSTTKNAEAALMSCYRNILRHGWPGGMGIGHCTYGAISGEVGRGYNWHSSYNISQQGLSVNGTDGSDAGAEHFGNNWKYIRQCYIVRENIDNVEDMSESDKEVIKAEALALVAYRYMGMFYRYGGVPIVTKSFLSTDDLSAPRATVQEMVDFITGLCDEAYSVLPAKWDNANNGRMTKGAVLAIKARTLQFAARPLFNSTSPYLSMKNSENNAFISFGNVDKERWNEAIKANEAVLSWASANGVRLLNTGGAGDGKPNPNAFDDYGKATSTPSNEEIILSFKFNDTGGWDAIVNFINCSRYQGNNRYDTDCSGVLTNHLENYWAADGSEMSWPKVGDAGLMSRWAGDRMMSSGLLRIVRSIRSSRPPTAPSRRIGGSPPSVFAGARRQWRCSPWGAHPGPRHPGRCSSSADAPVPSPRCSSGAETCRRGLDSGPRTRSV